MALLYANKRANVKQERSTSPIPERNCRLILPTDIDLSEPEINGRLIINHLLMETIPIAGVFVRFEINEFVKLDTRFDGRAETKVRVENLLAKETWATIYVLGEDSTICKLNLPTGRSEFHFIFKIGESTIRQFPAPLKMNNGSILYQIVAYIQRPYPDDKVYYQKVITTNLANITGYFNLSKEPSSNNLIAAEKSLQKSLFSKRSTFKATLHLAKTGFLAGEDVPFTISMNNVAGEILTKAVLSLARRIIWRTATDSKSTLTILDTKMKKDVGRETDEMWTDVVRIPKNSGPSANGLIDIQYVLRMEIQLSERIPIKNETTILIGTTWGDVATDNAIRQSEKIGYPARQGSAETPDGASCLISFPPSYSALSSRKPSIETLPPGYEDLLEAGIEELTTVTENDDEDLAAGSSSSFI